MALFIRVFVDEMMIRFSGRSQLDDAVEDVVALCADV